MKRKILIAVIILGLLTSCSGSGGTVNTEYIFTEPVIVYQEPNDTSTWLSPAIPTEISVTHAEYGFTTPPVYITIHYGPTDFQSYTSITANNTDDFAKLPYPLYADSIDHVQKITSSIDDETPYATSYDKDTQTLWLDGFLPNKERTIKIWYSHTKPAQFSLQCSIPSQPGAGYQTAPFIVCNWVDIAQTNPIMQPFETRDIPVVLTVPPNMASNIPSKFEFRIGAKHRIIGSSANVITKLESTWRIILL